MIMIMCSMLCKAVIHKRLLNHCLENNLISNKQAAYIKGDSTIHQLLYIVHKIKSSWTKGDITHGIFLDVKAAFDNVWHKGMIAKLSQINIKGKVLEIFTSYLTKRQQIVVIDGGKSQNKELRLVYRKGANWGQFNF